MDNLSVGTSGPAGIVGISGIFILPFTNGKWIVSLVVLTAIVCVIIIAAVKLIKQFIVRG